MKDDRLYLVHIRECIRKILRFTDGGRQEFFADVKTQDAVLRNLHTLSESTQRLSDSSRQLHPDIDWRNIAAFRNVVVHNYLGIDLDRVWQIVQEGLPPLQSAVNDLSKRLGIDDGDTEEEGVN